MLEDESWQQWRHKVGQAPTLECTARLCLKYHIRGCYFEDCTKIAPHKKLASKDYRITDEFIRKIRVSMN